MELAAAQAKQWRETWRRDTAGCGPLSAARVSTKWRGSLAAARSDEHIQPREG